MRGSADRRNLAARQKLCRLACPRRCLGRLGRGRLGRGWLGRGWLGGSRRNAVGGGLAAFRFGCGFCRCRRGRLSGRRRRSLRCGCRRCLRRASRLAAPRLGCHIRRCRLWLGSDRLSRLRRSVCHRVFRFDFPVRLVPMILVRAVRSSRAFPDRVSAVTDAFVFVACHALPPDSPYYAPTARVVDSCAQQPAGHDRGCGWRRFGAIGLRLPARRTMSSA